MRVTTADLRKLGACSDDLEIFDSEFGGEADVTTSNLERAFRVGLNVDCWAGQVFGAEFERVKAPAWAEFERVTAQAWAEFERLTAQAWAEFERVTAPARAEYERVKAQAIAVLSDRRPTYV